MHLEGWNSIPAGYGATFDLRTAPRWLRWWFSTPFVDRFAYPVVVRRGHGWLRAHPGAAPPPPPVGTGWRVRSPDDEPPDDGILLEPVRW